MRRTLLVLVAAVLALAVLAPAVSADHPGSNKGLARFLADAAPTDNLVHRLPDVEATFAAWEAAHPDLVERFTIGQTSSGFDLLGIKITDETVADDGAETPEGAKYTIYLDGGHHGNEYLGVELIMYYLEDVLVQHAAGTTDLVEFLRTHAIYAVPIINVDGNTLDTRKNGNQVDVNRNYPFEWGGEGAGTMLFDLTYRGPEPMSEAEVRANAEFGAELRPDLWITMHTGIAEFYWPWGWTFDKAPDWYFFESLEGPFENATNGRVDAMMAAELYLAAGATDDYGYGAVGVPTFTYEVHEDQFIPVYGEPINEIIRDQLAGLDFMVKNTKHLGARLAPTVVPVDQTGEAPRVRIDNIGWGNATNVTVRFYADPEQTAPLAEHAVGEVAAAGAVDVALPAGTQVVVVEYKPLYIDSAQPRDVRLVVAEGVAPEETERDAPSPAMLVVVVAALGLLAMLRRRD